MKNRILVFIAFAIAIVFALPIQAQILGERPTQPAPKELKLNLVANQASYAMGEPITVIMRYTLESDETIEVDVVNFDRSGRVDNYNFTAKDAAGKTVRDPSSQLVGSGLGGPINFTKLTRAQPFEQSVVINQWLAFDKPGIYSVIAHSRILRRGEDRSTPVFAVESAPLKIQITDASEDNRQHLLTMANVVLRTKDNENEQVNRQSREQIIKQLRFLLDERAIPILVHALGDGWVNVQHEAQLALLAFEDLKPVKAEIWRLVKDEKSVVEPRAKHLFFRILAEAMRRNSDDKTQTIGEFNTLLDAKLNRDLQALEGGAAAEKMVEAMREYQISRVDAANWNRVLKSASLMPEKSQKDAAELLSNQMDVDPKRDHPLKVETLRALKDALTKTARDEKVHGLLRSASIVGLSRTGDNSFRDFLVQEFKAPQPTLWKVTEWGHPWNAAQKTLGDYQSQEIAQALLKLYNAPKFFEWPTPGSEDYYRQRSILFRLMDFGQFLSLEELRAVITRFNAEGIARHDNSQAAMFQVLALKSPEAVVPFIRELPRKTDVDIGNRYQIISSVLTRLDAPEARELVNELFLSPDENDRSSVVSGFALSAQDAREVDPPGTSRLPIRPDLAKARFPDILRLFETDPSRRVRTRAHYALSYISGIGQHSDHGDKSADDQQFLAQWKKWWQENNAAQELKFTIQKQPGSTPRGAPTIRDAGEYSRRA